MASKAPASSTPKRRRSGRRRKDPGKPTDQTFAEAMAYRDTAELLMQMGKKRRKKTHHVQGDRHRSRYEAEVRRLKRARPAGMSMRAYMRSMALGGVDAAREWLQNKGTSSKPATVNTAERSEVQQP